jgi:hypothetical protein
MSENLDLVRSIYANWERGDFSEVEWADADIEYVIVGGPDPSAWKGRAAMARAWAGVLSAYSGAHIEADGYSTAGASSCACTPTGAEERAGWSWAAINKAGRTSSTSRTGA